MKTRRSKGGDDAADNDGSTAGTHVDIPSDLDLTRLEQLLPNVSFAKPGGDAILSLYNLILDYAREADLLNAQLEESRAEAVKKEVELDQTLQEHETRYKELEDLSSSKTAEVEKLKEECKALAEAKNQLESDHVSLNKTQNVSVSELESIKLELADTQREKRDLIDVIARLRSDDEQRENEVKNLRQELANSRQEHQDTLTSLSEVRSVETTMKFKIQYLDQQLELAQSTAEASNSELNQRNEEFAKYRREKQAEIVNLTSSLDTLAAGNSSNQSTLEALRQSYESQGRHLAQALQKVSDAEGRLAEQTASYRAEAANQARLIQLLESRSEQSRERVEEVENEWGRMVKAAEEREEKLSYEIEKEKGRADRLEAVAEEFQRERERMLEGSMSTLDENGSSSAPKPGPLKDKAAFSLSPAAGVAARLQKSGKTFTEVYSDYVKLQEELAKSQAERRRLEELLSQVLADLEERTPLLAQQRQDFERTKQEADQLANQLAQVISERDNLKLRSFDQEKQLNSSRNLIVELEQSASDLGRQIQHLLRQNAVMENPSLESVQILPAASPTALSANLALATDEVVLFQNLASLQAQNQLLLKVAHSSALALDRKEREFREALEREESEAIQEANEAIAVLEEQLEAQAKSHQVKLSASMKELEFVRSGGPRNYRSTTAIGDNSLNPQSPQDTSELQTQFDAYRTETEFDSVKLREELNSFQRETNRVTADLAKANGAIQFLNDRHRMQAEALQLKDRELQGVTQRCQDLRDQCTRLELAYNQVSDNLVQAHSTTERLRNESANLKAERGIWKTVEDRLTADNRALSRERSQLADLVGGIQKIHDDLDRANENDRRRQLSLVQALEAQIQELKSQLGQEREINHNTTRRKELECNDLHEKLEKARSDFATASQALAVAETNQKHTQEKLDSILVLTEAQREKLSVYDRLQPSGGANEPTSNSDSQLTSRIAQLSADLKAAQIELSRSQGHMEQYKGISESNEQAFQQLSSSFDQLQESTRVQLSEKEAEAQALLQRISNLREELTASNQKNAELKKSLETERLASRHEQHSLETKIVEMTTTISNFENDHSTKSTERKEQEERLQAAESKYENAIKAHAEAIDAANKWKEQLTSVQASVRESLSRADTAQSQLSAAEVSWNNQRMLLEKEMADVRQRCQELTGQNEVLHHQLEVLSSQASKIRQAATTSRSTDISEGTDQTDQQFSDLRSVISYLRKEKEILDLQLEVSKQEATRSKSEAEHLTRVLDETRRLLTDERDRAAQSATAAAEHAELVERINQLNLLRESNATLRAEAHSSKLRVSQLENELGEITTELDPLRQRVRVLEAEVESREEQVTQARREAEHWQNRNQQILSKYDRVDPAELQQLREQLESANSKVSELEVQHQEAQRRIAEETENTEKYKNNVALYKNSYDKLRGQSQSLRAENAQQKQQLIELETLRKERDALLHRVENELATEINQLRAEALSLQAEKGSLQSSLEAERTRNAQPTAVNESSETLAKVTAERDSLADAKKVLEAQLAGSVMQDQSQPIATDEMAALVKAKKDAEEQLQDTRTRLQASQEQVKGFRIRVQSLSHELQTSKEKIAALEKLQGDSLPDSQALDALTQKHARDLEAAVTEAREKALAEMGNADMQTAHARQVQELEERLKAEFDQERSTLNSSLVAASSKLADETAQLTSQLTTASTELENLKGEIESLKKENQAAVGQGLEQGRREMSTKIKLKDSQFSKLSKRLQEVEQALVTATNGEYKPQGLKGTGPIVITAAGSKPDVSPSAASPSQDGPVPTAPEAAVGATPLTSTSRGRGGVALRGAAARGRGAARGGSTTTNPAIPPSTASSGTAILGAAAKRTRDGEGDSPSPDVAAKRLKAGPVSINRNRALPQEPGAS